MATLAVILTAIPAGSTNLSPTKAARAVSTQASFQLAGTGRPHREVFGYVNAVNIASSTVGYSTWDFNDLSTVALFGLHVNTDGSFADDRGWSVWNSAAFAGLVSTAHAHGTKVVPSIIFHDYSSTQSGTVNTPMCQVLSPAATSHTVSDIMSEINVKGADGFNLNYEGSNQYCPNGQSLAQMLVTFVALTRLYMPSTYISISTYNGSYYPGYFFDIPHLNPYVDSFFVMDYDSTWSNYPAEPLHCAVYCFSPNGPLVRYDYNDTASVHGYLGIVPASKVIVGVPYYGNTACIPGSGRPGPNAVPYTDSRAHWSVPRYIDSRSTYGAAGVYYYQDSYDPFSPTDSYSTWWDGDYLCWRESYWDNYYALSAKYDLVNRNNLRGVGIFTLDYGGGSPELWSLLHDKFGGCIGAALTTAPSSPEPPGAVMHLTATASGCTSPTYEFWVQYPNGTWSMRRSWGGPTWDWNTAGLPLGDYTVHVWANQSGDPLGTYESFGELTFRLATLPPCSSATASPTTATQVIGTKVTFTATSTGCGTPQYAYWVQDPSGKWSLARPFTLDPAWSMDSSMLAAGTYTVHVWANQYGDQTAAWEAYGSATVTFSGCSSATLSPAATASSPGPVVTLAAGSTGCASPLYEFWVQYPNGVWYLKQGWSTSTTFDLATSGLSLGKYTVHVWANQPGGSMASWQAYGSATVLLEICSSASASPTSGSFASGTVVTVTASSTGCSKPAYEFWLQYPDQSWHMVQAFTAGNTWQWNTALYPKGRYTLHVWANEAGSNYATYQTYGSATYTVS
ncbi:MAG TPA: glycoside hydrolase family 18 protein [Candidatus Dormibacteraeota bacterium]|nr:glycoside hydrolase family 18 protein [Candidatus Dormibacteraeota bacterium]